MWRPLAAGLFAFLPRTRTQPSRLPRRQSRSEPKGRIESGSLVATLPPVIRVDALPCRPTLRRPRDEFAELQPDGLCVGVLVGCGDAGVAAEVGPAGVKPEVGAHGDAGVVTDELALQTCPGSVPTNWICGFEDWVVIRWMVAMAAQVGGCQ